MKKKSLIAAIVITLICSKAIKASLQKKEKQLVMQNFFVYLQKNCDSFKKLLESGKEVPLQQKLKTEQATILWYLSKIQFTEDEKRSQSNLRNSAKGCRSRTRQSLDLCEDFEFRTRLVSVRKRITC